MNVSKHLQASTYDMRKTDGPDERDEISDVAIDRKIGQLRDLLVSSQRGVYADELVEQLVESGLLPDLVTQIFTPHTAETTAASVTAAVEGVINDHINGALRDMAIARIRSRADD